MCVKFLRSMKVYERFTYLRSSFSCWVCEIIRYLVMHESKLTAFHAVYYFAVLCRIQCTTEIALDERPFEGLKPVLAFRQFLIGRIRIHFKWKERDLIANCILGFLEKIFYWSPNTWRIVYQPVAVTDLFSLANECPRQAIRPQTDQSAGRAHWFHPPLKNYFFLALFGSLPTDREYSACREKKTSLQSCAAGCSSIDDLSRR